MGEDAGVEDRFAILCFLEHLYAQCNNKKSVRFRLTFFFCFENGECDLVLFV